MIREFTRLTADQMSTLEEAGFTVIAATRSQNVPLWVGPLPWDVLVRENAAPGYFRGPQWLPGNLGAQFAFAKSLTDLRLFYKRAKVHEMEIKVVEEHFAEFDRKRAFLRRIGVYKEPS